MLWLTLLTQVDDPEVVSRWSQAVRGSVVDSELDDSLRFSIDRSGAYDEVKLWHIDIEDVESDDTTVQKKLVVSMDRPTEQMLKAQISYIDRYAGLRAERSAEILAQVNQSIPFWASIVRLDQHATESYMVAAILLELSKATEESFSDHYSTQLFSHAERVSINRTIAGVHFPCDSTAGRLLGTTLAEYLLSRAINGFESAGRSYLGSQVPESRYSDDFDGQRTLSESNREILVHEKSGHSQSGVLTWLWQEALKEWSAFSRTE